MNIEMFIWHIFTCGDKLTNNKIFEEFSNYVRAEVTGKWSAGNEAKEGIEFWTQAAELSNKSDTHRILAVINMPGKLPVLAAYDIASDPTRFGYTRAMKVAIVYPSEERYTSGRFAEDVAVNRGWRVKVFRDERDAKLWLIGD